MSSTNKQYCSVPQCSTYRSAGVTIHYFPKDPILKAKWAAALKIGKKVSKCMMVCSKHFKSTDFFPNTPLKTKKFLKKGVIPTQNIPIRSHDIVHEPSTSRMLRITNRNNKKIFKDHTQVVDVTTDEEMTENNDEFIQDVHMDIEANGEESLSQIIRAFEDKGVQVMTLSNEPKFTVLQHLMMSHKNISTFTGVNLNIFSAIEKSISIILPYFPNFNKSNIQLKICLVLTKLKLDMSFRSIAVLFSLSDTTAQNYFYEMVQLLSYALKPALYWPTKEENMKSMPKCFSKYQKVRVVIDATEIFIQKNNCLKCRIRSYSHYKKSHTCKFLICVTPSGLITHVSQAYGGRVSDKAIFNKEKVIHFTEQYVDAIMVDKGVLIENECLENAVALVRPPFLRQKKQFTQMEALETASIARARVHVERVIQRIKIFKIFQNKIVWSLAPYLDDCMTVICAIVNLSKPILADNKF